MNSKKLQIQKEKLLKIKQANRDHLMNYITKKFGSVCQVSVISGWIISCCDDKEITNLEKLGISLGVLLKLSYDFTNLEEDLLMADDKTNNFVINYGIQESFELFIDNKSKFIEGCIILDIYTNTVKEIVDLVETNVDKFVDDTIPDLKSQYTLSLSKSNGNSN